MLESEKGLRGLKSRAERLLREADPGERLREWGDFPAKRVVNILLSFLFHTDEILRWRAVTATGIVVARMADESMESARVILRRLMWSLNDESGGIGWGSPEAMAEIMVRSECLALEFSCILVSYIVEGGNLLENGPLECGVLWGIGRLAQVRPHLVRCAVPHVQRYLDSEVPAQRAAALWALGRLGEKLPVEAMESLLRDRERVRIFSEGSLQEFAVCELAERVLSERSGMPSPGG